MSEVKESAKFVVVFVWITCVHNICLFFYHYYNHLTHLQSTETIATLSRLSLIAMVAIIIYALINSIVTTYPLLMSCSATMISVSVSFLFAKLWTYVLIIERLFTLFKFSNTSKFTVRIVLLFYFFSQSILFFVYRDSYILESDDSSYLVFCRYDYPDYVIGLLPLWDIIICTLCSIVFVRRLISLNMLANESSNTGIINDQHVTWTVATKATLLTFIGLLIGTPLCLVLIILFAYDQIFMSIDCIINCWCIMLMINTSGPIYRYLCIKLEDRFVTFKCLTCWSCNCNQIKLDDDNDNDNESERNNQERNNQEMNQVER